MTAHHGAQAPVGGRHRKRSRLMIGAAAVIGAAAIGAAGVQVVGGSSASHGLRLKGTFTLFTSAQPQAKPCETRPGFGDVVAGAPVVVRNGHGLTIATGSLAPGAPEPSKRGCAFQFTIRPLPVAATYTVSVGKRGGLPYSYEDLQKAGWHLTMGLGAITGK
ncbi:MAG TPA: hypothetical protein VKI20_02385 [Acidimicrobiales bacterium]|nr:hypothetical protein [Acidimicrobiales bacterium]